MTNGLSKSESGAQYRMQSAWKLHKHRAAEDVWTLIKAAVEKVTGDVVEFHGAEGTGKTEMLYHLIARCLLPKSRGGLEVGVLFIDTDFHFDMLRLVTILEYRLSFQGTEATLKHCLERFFLINCHSSSQLLLSLYSLESMFSLHPSLSLLIIDSISAFYWVDRANGGDNLSLQEANLKRCVWVLQKLVKEHHLVLFATTQSLMQKSLNFVESSEKATVMQVQTTALFFVNHGNSLSPTGFFSPSSPIWMAPKHFQ